MKKALAIVFLVVGLGLAMLALKNAVDYPSMASYADHKVEWARSASATDQFEARIDARKEKERADGVFRTALLGGIGSFVALALAVTMWVLYRKGRQVRLNRTTAESMPRT